MVQGKKSATLKVPGKKTPGKVSKKATPGKISSQKVVKKSSPMVTQLWLQQKIDKLLAGNPKKTIGIVAHQSEIKDGLLESVLPEGLAECKDFRQDLNMNGSYWFYNKKRMLLIQKSQDKEGAKELDVRKSYRKLGATACLALQSKKTADVEFLVTSKVADGDNMGVFENSFYLSNYENCNLALRYKKPNEDDGNKDEDKDDRIKRDTKRIDKYTITCEDSAALQSEDAKFQKACALSTEVARNLCNTRASTATPGWMEQQVRELVKGYKGVKEVRVLQDDMLQKLNMNLFHAVGQGAESPPRCVMVHYQGDPSRKNEVDMALVGKGITFDTGGLNLKMMMIEDMYGDKGGSCAVAGAIKGVLEMQFKKNIVFALALAENAIGSKCYRPSDIIKSRKGISVEIGNTDAEGRLVLSDTMTYVQEQFKPKQMIDLATLTGSCIVALGLETAGIFSDDQALVDEFTAASKESFEQIWHLPIQDEHMETIKGAYSDIRNIGSYRWGGASQAAAFLKCFVEKGTQWAHLDIAGPAMAKVAKPPVSADQTGFGASLLMHFIKNKC